MGKLFDIYVAVDWSSRNAPTSAKGTKDSIFYAWRDKKGNSEVHPAPTRTIARENLLELLAGWKKEGKRVLVGFDFAFGYPEGFANTCFPDESGPAWERTWKGINELFKDDQEGKPNRNNRFEVADQLNQKCKSKTNYGPFWGLPNSTKDSNFLSKKRQGFNYPYPLKNGKQLQRLRLTDSQTGGVQEVWKLYGAGSVGSQTITGIPVLQKLRTEKDLQGGVKTWPFQTGFALEKGYQIIFAEIFPSSVPYLAKEGEEIPDRRQVRSVVHRMAELDKVGKLTERFGPPSFFEAGKLQQCIDEEGWILPLY